MQIKLQQFQAQVKKLHLIEVSQSWLNLFQFIQNHPFAHFENLTFKNGEPDLGEMNLKVKETFKF